MSSIHLYPDFGFERPLTSGSMATEVKAFDDWDRLAKKIKAASDYNARLITSKRVTFLELVNGAAATAVVRDENKNSEKEKSASGSSANNNNISANQITCTSSTSLKSGRNSDKKSSSTDHAVAASRGKSKNSLSSAQNRSVKSATASPNNNSTSSRIQLCHSPKYLEYPILFCSPHGTIAVYLGFECLVELTINKTIRFECQGKFSAATNAQGNTNCILHPEGRILQQDTRVQCLLGKNKVAAIGPQGVIFNLKPSPMAFIVSSTLFKGTTPIPANCMHLPPMDYDFTMSVFYNQSLIGAETVPLCQKIVREAQYHYRENGALVVSINGILIRQDRSGNVFVSSRPRSISASPTKNTVAVRTHFIDMAVQEDEKAYVKRGAKRVHVSKSGMVVSDGNCITSIDHLGRIVSST